jgi:hypothetical protein
VEVSNLIETYEYGSRTRLVIGSDIFMESLIVLVHSDVANLNSFHIALTVLLDSEHARHEYELFHFMQRFHKCISIVVGRNTGYVVYIFQVHILYCDSWGVYQRQCESPRLSHTKYSLI